MDEKANDTIKQVIHLVKQLPDDDISELKKELKQKISVRRKTKKKMSREQFRKFLLNGPVMSDAQYKEYLETRKWMRKWRVK